MPGVLDRLSKEEREKISKLFADKAAALPHHQQQVAAEKGNPTHTFTRHGYQTGWESQLMRLVTGRTPDQPEDEDGVRDAVQKYRDKEALPKKEQGKISYAAADSVGAFLCPEVEEFAITRARAKAAVLMQNRFAQTQSKAGTAWVPYDYIDMIVAGPQALSGVSFSRPKNSPPLVQSDAVQAIEDFIKGKRIEKPGAWQSQDERRKLLQTASDLDIQTPNLNLGAKIDYPFRFPSLSDLLAHLGVRAMWMRNVNVCLRRFGNNDWRIHTAYCVHCTEVPSPTRGGPSVKTGKWTGLLRATADGADTFVDPDTLK
jgi:hypothetical protein